MTMPRSATVDDCWHYLVKLYKTRFEWLPFSLRPYHRSSTGSRLITEVKQGWAALVLGWVTAWEHAVLYAFYAAFIHLFWVRCCKWQHYGLCCIMLFLTVVIIFKWKPLWHTLMRWALSSDCLPLKWIASHTCLGLLPRVTASMWGESESCECKKQSFVICVC